MKDYKNKHIGIILLLTGAIIIGLSPIPDNIQTFISAALAAIAGSKMYHSGKGDELTEYNISRANKIVMILLIAVILIFGFMGDDNYIVKIHENVFFIIAAVSVILRSILFLIFDRIESEDN